MGVINLLAGPYIIAITRHSLVGHLFGHPVYHVDEAQVWPVAEAGVVQVARGREAEEAEYVRLLRVFLAGGGFYYSRGYDLTSNFDGRQSILRLSTQTVPCSVQY